MKDRYLFRGKRIDNGEWAEGHYIVTGKEHYLCVRHLICVDEGSSIQYAGINMHEVIPETVGQFTGLTDKNGVKIFEGDKLSNTQGYFGHVEFGNGSFKLYRIINIQRYINLNQGFCANKEVIGNIHYNN